VHDDQTAEATNDTADANSLTLAKDSDDTQRDATNDDNGPCWIRTSDHQIMSPARGFANAVNDKSCDADSATPSNNTSNAAQNGPDLTVLADALAALPKPIDLPSSRTSRSRSSCGRTSWQ